MYYLFGINRLRTRAHQIKGDPKKRLKTSYERPDNINTTSDVSLSEGLAISSELVALARSSTAVTHRPLVEKNTLQPYFDGDSAYAEMLLAIDQAKYSVCLASYIFETNQTGQKFIDALCAAHARGVDVRVLVDGIGELYNSPTASRLLRKRGVNVAKFLPPKLFPPAVHINLRNHRKLLIVDGCTGFTGGMNIGDRHLKNRPEISKETADIHFQLVGDIVSQLQQVFDEDWLFVTGEESQHQYEKRTVNDGDAICRVVTDGPNEDLDKLTMIMTSAVALARKRVAIMTPYFLPPHVLVNALQSAALRGVTIDIILPQKSNLPLVHWATRNMLWELLQFGVHIHYCPPPFAHSKIFLIDDDYAHIGTANLDPRSLRLNFELVVEVFDREFVSVLNDHFYQVKQTSKKETLAGVDGRSLPIRLRDAFVWLFSPYL